MGHTVQNHVLHTALLTDPPLVFRTTIAIYHKNVRLHDIERRKEVQNPGEDSLLRSA